MHKFLITPLLMMLLFGCDKDIQSSHELQQADNSPTASAASQSHNIMFEGVDAESTAANPYLGPDQCVSCHQKEFLSWRNSHHSLAMQKAGDTTVLGNFNNVEFNYFGAISSFYKKGGKYFVRTDGPEGEMHDYPVAYTFGVQPLQQYLIEFPNGKLQSLTIAWDSRRKADGGQRWFHLYPEEQIKHGDPLHWTGINQNWNFMCADCHSTNLKKNYDLASQSYDTSWSEINVSCEACHGPGSRHVQWAQNPKSGSASSGLSVSFAGRNQVAWVMDTDTGIARLEQPANTQGEIETCAQCHSRRATSFLGAKAGDDLLDHFNLALLGEPLYHADGQINGEVYAYGSFLQSKMHAAGVTCSNCHDPHSLKLRVEGNSVCAQCHMPKKFDTAEHHFHPAKSAGAQCANCHMPTKTYMQVDVRRDHSFRIPRPDLSDKLETPNACTGCHTDRSNTWAAEVLERKFGKPTEKHYGEALYAGRNGLPGAESKLMDLITDESQPAIARATAVSLLPHYLSQQSLQLLQIIAQSEEPLLSLGLAKSLEFVPPQVRPVLGIPLLYEDKRVTSTLAANAMAGLPVENYPTEVQKQFTRALNNYLKSEKFNSDRPESLANLAGLYVQLGDYQQAETFYQRALSVAPYYGPAYINLAELYRTTEREKDTEILLRKALKQVYEKAPIQHSLGLSLVRQQRMEEALEFLRQAADNPISSSRYIYVYAIALKSTGKPRQAISVLEHGLQRYPHSPELLQGLLVLNRELGNAEQVQHYEQLLRQ